MHEISSRLKEGGHGIHLAGFFISFFSMQMILPCEQIARSKCGRCSSSARNGPEYRVIFSLKKCEIVEYGEWDLQGGKVLEGKVYKYLGILFHQSLRGKAHTLDLNDRVRP